MKNKIMVTPTTNGAVVFRFDDENIEGLEEMLYELVDMTSGCNRSRYNEKRIKISIVHGDKFKCPKGKNCEICGGVV